MTPTEKMPRDYALGDRAYRAFFGDSPQLAFEDLAHDYQMRWVEVARKVLIESQRLRRNGPVELDAHEVAALSELNPKVAGKRRDRPSKAAKGKRRPIAWKTAPNKKWRELTKEERNARQRESYERSKLKA